MPRFFNEGVSDVEGDLETVDFGTDISLSDHENLEMLLNAMQRIQHPGLDEFGTVNQFLDMKARKKGVPIRGMFELTPLCNLDCKMCYVHLSKEQLGKRRLLSTEEWKHLMKQAIDAGMMDAMLTGGECLTYPGFDELYLFLHAHGIRTGILTNGLLLTEERLEFFRKHPPKGFQITLYGSSDEEYERVTGVRCFEQIMQNIQRLRTYKFPVYIAITPNRFMLDNGEQLLRLVHHMGVSYSINTTLFTPREETGRSETAIDMELDSYIQLQVLRRKLSGYDVIPHEGCILPQPSGAGRVTKGLMCSGGSSSFFISWDGRLLPCGSFTDCQAYPLQIGFDQAWQRVRTVCKEYLLPQECGDCVYNVACPACVMVHAQDCEPGHASPRICARARKQVEAGLVKLDKTI